MATVKEFSNLDIWKLSRKYCQDLYSIFSQSTWNKNFPLRNQLDGSSGSVMDNIAEGFDRGGNKEFIQFLSISKASCGESMSQIYRAYDRELITKPEMDELIQNALEIKNKIGAFMVYLKKSDKKGFKYD